MAGSAHGVVTLLSPLLAGALVSEEEWNAADDDEVEIQGEEGVGRRNNDEDCPALCGRVRAAVVCRAAAAQILFEAPPAIILTMFGLLLSALGCLQGCH
jgi:hypothetical protein